MKLPATRGGIGFAVALSGCCATARARRLRWSASSSSPVC